MDNAKPRAKRFFLLVHFRMSINIQLLTMKLSFTFALLLAYYLQEPIILVSGSKSGDCKKEVPARYDCIYCGPGSKDRGTINCDFSIIRCSKDCYCNTPNDDPDKCFDLTSAASLGMRSFLAILIAVLGMLIAAW